jgi:hypothetical protein
VSRRTCLLSDQRRLFGRTTF